MRDYTKIKAWQKADDLTVRIYGASKGFPRQYFLRLAWRLDYLSEADHDVLAADVKEVFLVLHGLISAVERDCGRIGRVVAGLTSLLVVSGSFFLLRVA